MVRLFHNNNSITKTKKNVKNNSKIKKSFALEDDSFYNDVYWRIKKSN